MRNKLITLSLVFGITLFSCDQASKDSNAEKKDTATMAMPKTDSVKFTVAMVDNAKDPSCGMPVGAGIEDTAHYNSKVLGFCSKECKEDFMKDAAAKIASVEWKK